MSRFSDSDHRKLEATVLPDCVVESHQVSDTARGLRRVQITKLWRTERIIGHGAFGEVLLQALDNDVRNKRALKVIRGVKMTADECQRELTALIEFTKPKYQAAAVFVDFFGWFQNPNDRSMYLAMEYMREGDLEANLLDLEASTQHGLAIPEEEVKEITSQILEGLKIMHIEGFAHRDLKPKNIFVVQRKPEWWVKLGDFGLTKKQTEETVYRTQAGTMQYMGPELYYYVPGLNDETSEYTNAVDIWALGCIVYRIMTRTVPFPTLLSLRNYSNSAGDLNFGVPYPMVEAEAFVRELLSPHPAKRPSASTALGHSWVVQKKEKAKKIFEYTAASTIPENSLKSQGAYNTISHLGLQSYQSPPDIHNASGSSLTQVPVFKPVIPPEVKTERSAGSQIAPIFSRQKGLEAPENSLKEAITPIEYSKRKLSAHRKLSTLSGHLDYVYSVAFSPDGQVLASGSWDKTIELWDLAIGRVRSTLNGHSGCVYSVAFSPDGQVLASGSWDHTIELWDLAIGRVRSTLIGHSDCVYSVAFSPDGQVLASGSWDKTIKLWDMATGRVHSTIRGHSGCVYSVAFSPDGRLLASGSYDKTIKLWDLAIGRVRSTLNGHSGCVDSVAFSPDGQLLASGSSDHTVKL